MYEPKTKPATLVIGIGNKGRNDDGLGWNFAAFIEQMRLPKVSIEYRYQLQIEDAYLISQYDRIFFADASHKKIEAGFEISPCNLSDQFYFSTHSQSPESILYLANALYQKCPPAFTIAIEGINWNFEYTLTETAKHNLNKAIQEFERVYY